MQREKIEEVRSWLQKASRDLMAADADITHHHPLTEDALFHCQQAAEKSMKGFLTAHDRIFRRTHDLDELARACESIDASLAEVLVPARDLTVFAWEFRYPGDLAEPPLEEAREGMALARRVFQAIVDRLPENVRP